MQSETSNQISKNARQRAFGEWPGCTFYVVIAVTTAFMVTDIRLGILCLAIVSLLTCIAAMQSSLGWMGRPTGFIANSIMAGIIIGLAFALAERLGQTGVAAFTTVAGGLLLITALEMFLALVALFAIRPPHHSRSLPELLFDCLAKRYCGAGGWLFRGFGRPQPHSGHCEHGRDDAFF